MATVHHYSFDTLAYTKALIEKGYERDKAEALAEAQRDFFVNDLATKDFVQDAVQKATTEIKAEIKQETIEIKHEIEKVNNRIDHEIEKVHLAIKEANQSLKIWLGSMAFLIVGALATIMKLLN